jgi:hypothetical protein
MKILSVIIPLIVFFLFIISSTPCFAQQVYNPQSNQWEYRPQPNVPVGSGGAIDNRTGTYFAPSGTGGVVNTQDGSQWMRSGDFLIDTRTGGTVHSPSVK